MLWTCSLRLICWNYLEALPRPSRRCSTGGRPNRCYKTRSTRGDSELDSLSNSWSCAMQRCRFDRGHSQTSQKQVGLWHNRGPFAGLLPLRWVGMLACLALGCAGKDELTMPTYTPDAYAKQALAEYDTNKDGFLDAKELERCPALKKSLEAIDTNGDHKISAEELASRIQMFQDSQVALKAVGCHVTLDGKPLQGATITYVPEKFMGSSVRQATGTSDERGAVALFMEGERTSGVQPGFYRVQVSKKGPSGQESIPAR